MVSYGSRPANNPYNSNPSCGNPHPDPTANTFTKGRTVSFRCYTTPEFQRILSAAIFATRNNGMKKIILGIALLLFIAIGGAIYYVFSNLDAIVKLAIEKYGSEA